MVGACKASISLRVKRGIPSPSLFSRAATPRISLRTVCGISRRCVDNDISRLQSKHITPRHARNPPPRSALPLCSVLCLVDYSSVSRNKFRLPPSLAREGSRVSRFAQHLLQSKHITPRVLRLTRHIYLKPSLGSVTRCHYKARDSLFCIYSPKNLIARCARVEKIQK